MSAPSCAVIPSALRKISVLVVLALLVSNRAGGLACRLAGSLALAAAALASRFLQSTGIQSLDVRHNDNLLPYFIYVLFESACPASHQAVRRADRFRTQQPPRQAVSTVLSS